MTDWSAKLNGMVESGEWEEDELAKQKKAENQQLTNSLKIGVDSNPDEAASIDKLSIDTGLPVDVVKRNKPQVESDNKWMNMDIDAILAETPSTARFLSNPKNSSQSHDDIKTLQGIERSWLAKTGDVGRGFGGGLVSSLGAGMSGIGRSIEAGTRIFTHGVDAILPESMDKYIWADPNAPEWVKDFGKATDIGGSFRSTGDVVKDTGEAIGPDEANRNFATDVAGAVGQVAGQIAISLVNPAAASTLMFGQGVEQQGEKQEALGVEGSTVENDLAMMLGGAATMVLEKAGLDQLLNRIPPAIKNRVLRQVLDIGAAGGIEAVEELVENITHNVIEYAVYNPNAEIFEGIEHDAMVGGGAGMVVRGILNAITPGRNRANSEQDHATLDGVITGIEQSKLNERNTGMVSEYLEALGAESGSDMLYLDIEGADALFQNVDDPEAVQPEIVVQIMDRYEAAVESGDKIMIPLADLPALINAGHARTVQPFMTTDIDAMSPVQTNNTDIKAEVEAIQAMDADARTNELDVYNKVFGMEFARTQDRSKSETHAILMEATFRTMSRRMDAETTPMQLFDRFNPDFSNEVDPAIQKRAKQIEGMDLMLNRLRTGDFNSDQDMFGESLIQFIRSEGGIIDEGGELAAKDAKSLIRPNTGKTLDDIAERAVEEGFMAERDPVALMDLIDNELRGTASYRLGAENQDLMNANADLDQLQQLLDRAGLDMDEMSNEEIRDALTKSIDDDKALKQDPRYERFLARQAEREAKTKSYVSEVDQKLASGQPAIFRNQAGSLFYTVTLAANSDSKYQVTVWDDKGAISDSKHDDSESIVRHYSGEIKGISNEADLTSMMAGEEIGSIESYENTEQDDIDDFDIALEGDDNVLFSPYSDDEIDFLSRYGTDKDGTTTDDGRTSDTGAERVRRDSEGQEVRYQDQDRTERRRLRKLDQANFRADAEREFGEPIQEVGSISPGYFQVTRAGNREVGDSHYTSDAAGAASGTPDSAVGVWAALKELSAANYGDVLRDYIFHFKKPYSIKYSVWEETKPDTFEKGVKLKEDLLAEGYDGIIIVDDTPGRDSSYNHLVSLAPDSVVKASESRMSESYVDYGALPTGDVDILLQQEQVDPEETPEFKKWAGEGAVVVESDEINDMDFSGDGPFVLKPFHGTTHDFDTFDASIKGSKEGQFGAVNYFSSSEHDVHSNYLTEGPDLTGRIDRRAEQIAEDSLSDHFEGTAQELMDKYSDFDSIEMAQTYIDQDLMFDDLAQDLAREEMTGEHSEDGTVMEVYVRTEKPFVVGGNDNMWYSIADIDAMQSQAIDRVAEEHDIETSEVEENMDDYQDEVDEARYEIEADEETDLALAIQTVADRYEFDASEILAEMYEMSADGEVQHKALEEFFRGSEGLQYVEDPETGDVISSHIIGEVIQELGFDSIILKDANDRFSTMDMEQGTAHVHVFDANNTNIKSVDNQGTFNKDDPNIFHQEGDSGDNLYVAHNLSEDNLKNVLDLGGLAAPSLAVGNIDTGSFDSFGDITLLADPSMMNDKSIPFFDADIYSPRQPRAYHEIDYQAYSKLIGDLEENTEAGHLGRMPSIDALEDTHGSGAFLNNKAFQYHWLKSQDKAPKPKKKKVDPTMKKAITLAKKSKVIVPDMLAKDPKFRKLVEDYYIEMGTATGDPMLFFTDNGSLKERAYEDYALGVKQHVRDGGVDNAATRNAIDAKMRTKKNQKDFEAYAEETFAKLLKGKKVYTGTNNMGQPKYKPYNLENVVKSMVKDLRGGEGFNYHNAGQMRASVARKIAGVDAAKKRRDQIISPADMEAFKDEAQGKMEALLESIKSKYKFDQNGYGYQGDAIGTIMDYAMRKGRLSDAFEVDAELQAEVTEFLSYLQDLPSEYFEGKAQRSMQLSEFKTAIVPRSASKATKQALRDAGMKIKLYNDGDKLSRTEAIRSQKDVLFQPGENRKQLGDKKSPAKRHRGSYNSRTRELKFTENQDLSTFLHESGHLFLDMMRELRGESKSIDADFKVLETWFDENKASDETRPSWKKYKAAKKASLEEEVAKGIKSLTTRQINKQSSDTATATVKDEMFASGFETYLMEGKAPTKELEPLFSRFRLWLTTVYKSLTRPFAANQLGGTQLSDEVRGVMDRLVATQDEIDAKTKENMYGPVAATQLGLNPEEAEEYQKLWNASEDEAMNILAAEVMKEVKRDHTKWWKEQTAEMRERITEEVASQQAYVARDTLVGGKDMPVIKLNYAEIKGIYGKEIAMKLKPMLSKDGMTSDLASAMFKYNNGYDLVMDLVNTLKKTEREKFIKAQADAEMKALHGDMTTDGSLGPAAETAVRNDKRSELLLKELQFIDSKSGKKSTPRQFFKAAAENTINGMAIKDIKPHVYKRNENNARMAAIRAVASGDNKTGALEQHRALRQHYLYKEAVKALENAEKAREFGKSLSSGPKAKTIEKAGDSYIGQVNEVLSWLQFKKLSDKDIRSKTSMTEWVNEQLALAGEGNPEKSHEMKDADEQQNLKVEAQEDSQILGANYGITEAMMATTKTKNYRELTPAELADVDNMLHSIYNLAKLKTKLLANKDKRELEEATTSLIDSILSNVKNPRGRKRGSTQPRIKSLKEGGEQFLDLSRTPSSFIRMLDGFEDYGPAWELIGQPLQDAAVNETVELQKANDALEAIFDIYTSKNKLGVTTSDLPDMNNYVEGGDGWTKHDIVSMLLNWGNTQNRQRVTDGFGMTEDQVLALFDAHLTERDFRFAKEVWAYLETFKKDSFALHKDIFGFTPAEVEAEPFMTKYGMMPGGYYPIKYDTEKSVMAEQNMLTRAADSFSKRISSANKVGSNQARQAKVKRSLQTDMSKVIFGHVSEVVHATTHDRALLDAGRLLAQDSVKGAITESYGHHVYSALSGLVRDLKDGAENTTDFIDNGITWARNNATLAMLGGSIRTIILQPFGFTNSIAKARLSGIGTGKLLNSYAKFAASPSVETQRIKQLSDYMASREQVQNVAIARIRNKLKQSGNLDKVREAMMVPMQKMQFYTVDAPLWMAAHEAALDNGYDNDKAVDLADQAVRDAQGGGSVIDTAGAMKGGPARKLFTNFLSYMVTTYTLQAENYQRNFKKQLDGERHLFDFTVNTFLLLTAPALLTAWLNDIVAGPDDEEEFVDRAIVEQISFVMGMSPVSAQFSGAVTGWDYSGPQGTAIISKTINLSKQFQQGEADAGMAKAAIWVGGLVTGLPAAQANRTIFGIINGIDEGDSIGRTVKKAAFGPER